MTMHEEISSRFPIRKTRAQKEAFRSWVLMKAEEHGYAAQVESKRILWMNHNVVIGDPEQAEVVITAHYDTPAVMPVPNFITPRNIPVYLLYQMVVVVMFALVCVALKLVTSGMELGFQARFWLSWGACMALLVLMLAGPANRHNANDNTSGVAAVMQLMTQLPPQMRKKAAFILFDNEEKGMLGSSAYAGKHKQVKQQKLLINLDCVGVGENMLFFAPKQTRALPAYELLQQTMMQQQDKTIHFFPAEKSIYPSDQAQFAHGIAVCACRKNKHVGFYCSRIHTVKDTECDQRCLDVLTTGLQQLIEAL